MSEQAVLNLYEQLLTSWNERNADRYASLISDDGLVIGFDGSTMHGTADVEEQLDVEIGNDARDGQVHQQREGDTADDGEQAACAGGRDGDGG